jgi:hypothetical protein
MNYPQRHFLNQNERSCCSWRVVRHLSNFQSIILAHFFSRAEAEAHVRFLKRANLNAFYEVVFDESAIASHSILSQKNFNHSRSLALNIMIFDVKKSHFIRRKKDVRY